MKYKVTWKREIIVESDMPLFAERVAEEMFKEMDLNVVSFEEAKEQYEDLDKVGQPVSYHEKWSVKEIDGSKTS